MSPKVQYGYTLATAAAFSCSHCGEGITAAKILPGENQSRAERSLRLVAVVVAVRRLIPCVFFSATPVLLPTPDAGFAAAGVASGAKRARGCCGEIEVESCQCVVNTGGGDCCGKDCFFVRGEGVRERDRERERECERRVKPRNPDLRARASNELVFEGAVSVGVGVT